MAKKPEDPVTGIETTGHEWDGIEELNNPLPRWWLWTFYATIVWGIGYTLAYPAWPLLNEATAGFLGFSTREQVAEDIRAVEERNAEVSEQLANADLSELSPDDPAHQFGVSGGAAIFRSHCSQCHGAGAAGTVGYPNLLDDAWLWGGSLEAIEYTVRHGIRNDSDVDARWSQMPAYDGVLSDEQISATAEYVLSLSEQPHDAGLAGTGSTIYSENCASCHGEAAMGDPDLGAPNLSDAIWLYGGSKDAIVETITYSRFGVMPPWEPRLSDAEIKAVTLYVHQLGGGE